MAPFLLLNLAHEIAGGSVQMSHTSWAYRFRFDSSRLFYEEVLARPSTIIKFNCVNRCVLNEYKSKLEHSHHQPLIAAFLNQHTWTDARQDHHQPAVFDR